MLGSFVQATFMAGKPVIETGRAARGAIISNSTSDSALSDAARKCNNFLNWRDVVESIANFVTWTCSLEDVGAISSIIFARRREDFKPQVVVRAVFVPCAFHVETAIFQTVGSERLMARATLLVIIRS